VKVKSPTFPNGHRYLKPEVIEALFDSEGNIKKSPDSKSVHAVTSTQGLYFKQMPFQPLMEYAIHNLFFRIGGHLTATNELVLLEISLGEDHKITYPVLISREVRGSTLQKIAQDNPRFEEDVNKTRLTWLLLCSILTRPGDGRLSNYILSDGNIIFCIDNDISFVEPVIGRVFKEIKFCSALFCLCTSLDQDVLRQFAALNAGAVLNGWIDEVIKTEEKYKKLFTEEERKSLFAGEIISRQRLYRKKSGHIFTPTILLVEGDLAILNQQFIHLQYYLQRQLQNGQEITMHDLLAHLITLTDKKDSSVGYDVCKAYTTQATSPLEKRLEKAVGKRDQSQTPAEYLKSAFRTPPSWEDIEKKQLCSPLKAKEELLFSLRCADVAEGKIDPEGASTLRANFIRLRSVSDPSRQDKVLRALQFWASQNSYTEIIITHCSGLNSETLEPFLQPTLEHLDISHSPQIRSRAIVHIQERCPRLKKLILEGCSELDDIKPRASPIFFASLEELSLGSCNNLRSLNIKAPQLKVLHLQKTSSLLTAQLDVLRFPRIDFEDSSCIDIQHNNLQEICQERRDFENARHFYTQLLASLERKPPTAITGVALYRLGWISAHLKLSHEAIAYYERSLALYKELKDFPAMSAVLRNLVILLMSERDTPLNRDKEKRYQREYLELPQAKDISWQLETDKESALKDVQKNCLVLQLLGLKLSQDDAIIRVSPFFGRGKWLKFFGKVAIEPPLPLDIQEILSGPCPIFPGKRVIETHFLTLIPEGMTLERLEALTLNPREGNKMGFRYKDDTTWAQHSKTPSGRAHWVLMTNDVIPGSRGKSWKDQQALAAKFKGQGYELLSGIEAATCVLLEYVQTGRRFYTTDPYTFTRCIEQVKVGSSQWPLAIGGFAPGGVVVNAHVGYRGNRGVGVARKFH
jgi:tetratricopeptide (TPR) repeat protein